MVSIPKTCLAQLKCTNCLNYLNYFPIMEASEDEIFCGRCKTVTTANLIHAQIYEIVASNLKFPCTYSNEGCPERLYPSDVENHEKFSCTFKVYNCPVISIAKCLWKGTCDKIKQHCEEIHPQYIIENNEFDIDFENLKNEEKLIIHDNIVYILKQNFDSKLKFLEYLLLEIAAKKDRLAFEIELSNNINFQKFCIDFSSKVIGISENITDSLLDFKIKFCIDNVKEILGKSSVVKAAIKFNVNERTFSDDFKTLLPELTCFVCTDYLKSPITICSAGHNVCTACKPKITACPTCKTALINNDPVFLKKVINQLEVPCKYFTDGCKYFSKIDDLLNIHHLYCPFGARACPLKTLKSCTWSGLANCITEHIQTNHPENFTDHFKVDLNETTTAEKFCIITQCDGKLFKLDILTKSQTFNWLLQLIGPENESAAYNYELMIKGKNEENFMNIRKNCSPLQDETQLFKDGSDFISLTWNQLKFDTTKTVQFQVEIFK